MGQITEQLTDEQTEHLATFAAERGWADIEDMCDQHIADGGCNEQLIDCIHNDSELLSWMTLGGNVGYSRRPADFGSTVQVFQHS